MKVKIVQHVWHSKEPVFSLDFHPAGYLVTGGSDKTINIWDVSTAEDGSPTVSHVADLQGHTKAVNCVRFSHSGHCLASSGDHGEIIIWRPAVPGAQPAFSSAAAVATPPGTAAGATTAVQPQTPGATTQAASPAATTPTSAAVGTAAANGDSPDAQKSPVSLTDGGAIPGSGSSPSAAAPCTPSSCCWKQSSSLRGHHDDVMDLAWSHDDAVVMSGSVDNEVMMFDVENRKSVARFTNHRHFVQGVAWDPLGSYMVSYSQDRTVRIHTLKPPPSGGRSATVTKTSAQLAKDIIHTHTLSKRTLPLPVTPPQQSQPIAAPANTTTTDAIPLPPDQQQQQQKAAQVYMFQDETLDVFFRRLAWSPDGAVLAIPAGLIKSDSSRKTRNATYLYARGQWTSPLACLPCPAKASIAVKFCPVLFKLRGSSSSSPSKEAQAVNGTASAGGGVKNVLGLPYRLVMAVATLDSVLLYDMQTLEPFLLAGPLHYSQITDLAWSRDGGYLAVSSRDGYCSLISFKQGELGDPIPSSELPAALAAAMNRVTAQAAATAAKYGASSKTVAAAVAATPLVQRPVSAGAGAAGVVSPTGCAAGTGAGQLPGSGTKPQQQQQKAGVKRIQPQQVVAASSPTAVGASSQPRRIAPLPVATGPGGVTVGQGATAGGPAQRRVTPTPVAPTAHSHAAGKAVIDLTAEDQTAAAAKAVSVADKGRAAVAKTTTAATAAAAAAPRRVTPQPVVSPVTAAESKQQQQPGLVPPTAAAPAGRVGLAAIQAAMSAAAARKRAAEKHAACESVDADQEAAETSKRVKRDLT